MRAYLSFITQLSSQELLSTDLLAYFNHAEWNEGANLHYYYSVIFIQRSHTLLTKTITYTLYETVTQKAIVVFTQNPDSAEFKFLKKKSMEKVLSFINKTFFSSQTIKPAFQDIEQLLAVKATLPKNVSISHQLEDVELSTKLTCLESPQTEKYTDKTLSNATSSTYAYLRKIPKQSVRKFNKLLRILMISAVSVVLLNLVINFTLFGTLQSSIENINDGTNIMNVLARQRYWLSLTVFYFKQLLLYDLGVTFTLDRPTIKSKLLNLSESLTEDLKEIHEYDKGSDQVQRLSEVKIVWYEYYGDHFELDDKNLVDVLERIISLILKFKDLEEVTIDDPYLIEMYRNGYAEVMVSFNRTVRNFGDDYEGMISEFVGLYQVVMIISICILAMLQGLGLAYILYILNKERVKIWAIYAKLPKQVINSMLARLRERLMDKYNEDLGEVSSKSSHLHLHYKHLFELKKLYFLTAVFVIVSLVTVTYIYTIVLPKTHKSIKNKLKLNDWTGQQQTYLYMSAFWSRECGYHLSLIKEDNYYEEPKIQLYKALEGLEFTHKKAYEGSDLSSNIKDIYLGGFNSTHYFEKGLHPRVSDIVSIYRIICDLYETGLEAGRQYAINHTPLREEIESQCNEVIGEIDKASEDKLNEILDELLVVILLLLGGMTMIIIIGLMPVVSKLRDIFEKEANFISFIPFEDSSYNRVFY
jgi:hypothetical protein